MNVPIVYVTNYVDYWRRAFKVHAFGFIMKPFNKDEFCEVMDDYFTAIHDASEETITFPTDDGAVCVKLNEIYYFMFESKKKVCVHTDSKRVMVRENLTDIYERLDKTQFYRTRRDCIVNLKYVQKLQNNYVIIMKNGHLLPLAQKKKNEFMSKLSVAFIKKLKGRNI
jgi:two-component system LytT family response regulator